MAHLPNKSERVGYKLVGASLPLRVTNYLEIFCLAKGTSKSKLLLKLIEEWKLGEENLFGQQEEVLLRTIGKRVSREWSKRKAKYPNIVWDDYKEGLIKEFEKKRFTDSQIQKILKQIK